MKTFKNHIYFTILLYWVSAITIGQELKLGLPLGHTGYVSEAKFSPDGKTVLTASGDGTARIWETYSGKLLNTLEGHTKSVKSAVFSSDGKKILTASWDNTARIWDTSSGTLIKILKGHTNALDIAIFSPDERKILTKSQYDNTARLWDSSSGKLIITLEFLNPTFDVKYVEFSSDGEKILMLNKDLRLWDTNSGKLIKILEGHTKLISSAIFSPNGKKILTVSWDNTVCIWDSGSGKLLKTLKGHSKRINNAIFSPNGEKVLTASMDNTARIWSSDSGKLLKTLKGHISIENVTFSPDGKNILTKFWDNSHSLWNASSGKLIINFNKANSANFSPDGKKIFVYNGDKIIQILDANSGKSIIAFDIQKGFYYPFTFSPKGDFLLTHGSTISIWDVSLGKLITTLESKAKRVVSANFNPNSEKILILYNQNAQNPLFLLDIKSGNSKKILMEYKKPITSANFSQDGKKIITSSEEDYATHIWDSSSGKLLNIFEGYSGVLSNDGKTILTKTKQKTISTWNTDTGKLLNIIKGHEEIIFSANFNKKGDIIITTSMDYIVRLWSASSAKLLSIIVPEERGWPEVLSAIISPSGKKILTATSDNYAHIWDISSGKLLNTFEGHTKAVWSAVFSPNGDKILTSSFDKTARIWDATSGELLNILEGHDSEVNSAVYSLDEKKIITASNDGSTILWDAPSGKQLIRQFIFDKEESLLLLPDGYYYATKKATSKLYYIKGLQTIGFEQLDVKFNRPDKVLEVLGNITGSKDTIMIKAYKKAWQKRIKKLGIDTTSFKVGFSIPESDFFNRDKIAYKQNNSELKLHIKALDSTYLLDRFNIWINEVPVYGSKGISLRNKKTNAIDTTLIVKLSNGNNKIETSVLNVNGIESYRQPLYINYTPKEEIKEKLYFVGIGIDLYKEEGHNLKYSVKDIRDLSAQLKEKYGNQIEIDTLFNQNVTIKNVQELKRKLKNSKVDDKIIISFSGHGLLSKDLDYYLGTYNVNFNSPQQNGLPYDDLEYLLDGIPSRKKLLLIDACHSGEVDKDEVEAIAEVENEKEGLKGTITIKSKNAKMGMKNSFELMKELFHNIDRATGATIISAAAGTQFAQERGALKNGVFTYCILNQLKEKETITVSELKQLVSKQVKEITNGLQQPTSRNQTIENDWKVW